MKRLNSTTFVAINLVVIGGAAFVATRPTVREIFILVGAVASTFVGAWFAFQFGAERARRDKRDKDISAGNLALVVLIEFLDRDLQHQRHFIDPVRNNPNFWWVMRPGQDLDTLDLKVDHAGLSFLLQRHATAWRAIVLEERRHKLLAKTIADRTKLLSEVVFPKFESAGIHHGQAVLSADIEKILGPKLTAALKDDTHFIVEMTDSNIQSLEACVDLVRTTLTALYPEADFVGPPQRLEPQAIQ